MTTAQLDITDTNAVNDAAYALYLSMNGKNLCNCGREKDTQDARCLTCQDQISDADDDSDDEFETPDAM